MSRLIKFRALVKYKNKEAGWVYYEPLEIPHAFLDEQYPNDRPEIIVKNLEFIGMQDKNKKDIFEHDILKHDLWGITYVIWEHGMFRATNAKEDDLLVDVTMADHQLKRTRVIGNIWENKDLIQKPLALKKGYEKRKNYYSNKI